MGWTHWRLEINFKSTSLFAPQLHWNIFQSYSAPMPLKTSGISQTPYTTQCTHPETHLPTDEPQQPTPESTLPNTVPPTKQLNKQGVISLMLLHYSCSCRLKRKTQIAPLARRKQPSHIYCSLTRVKMWVFSLKTRNMCHNQISGKKNNFPTHPNKRQFFEVWF
jgi:hypothetical protein